MRKSIDEKVNLRESQLMKKLIDYGIRQMDRLTMLVVKLLLQLKKHASEVQLKNEFDNC